MKNLISYIKKARFMGFSDPETRKHLLDSGWTAQAINKAFFLADQNKIRPVANKRRKRIYWLAASAALLLIAVAVWFYSILEFYGFADTTLLSDKPKALMEQFLLAEPVDEPVSITTSILFSETNATQSEPIQLEGTGYANLTNPEAIAGQLVLHNGALTSALSKTSIEFRLVEGNLYTNIDDGGKNTESVWSKRDPQFGQELLALLFYQKDGVLDSMRRDSFDDTKFLDWEVVDNKRSAHFEIMIEGDSWTRALQKIFSADQTPDNATLKKFLHQIQLNKLEIWLDRKGAQLVQFKLSTNAPSLLLLSSLMNEAAPLQADDKRLADIRAISNALEVYFHDNSGYPETENGSPLGLIPKYLEMLPIAPRPSGICKDYYNTYWYQPSGRARRVDAGQVYPDYNLTFCLGKDIGGFKAGVGTLSSKGIQTSQTCPAERPDCFTTESELTRSINQILQTTLSGQLELQAIFTDRGVEKSVEIPSQNQ